jgi:hypothetical protein
MKNQNFYSFFFYPKRLLMSLMFSLFIVVNLFSATLPELAVTKPSTAFSETGEYRGMLEKMHLFLQEDELWDFYLTVADFIKKTQPAMEESRSWPKSKEEAIALEWMYYFVTIAPIVPAEIWTQKIDSLSASAKKQIWPDVYIKNHVLASLVSTKMDDPSFRESNLGVYRRKHGLTTNPELFSTQESKLAHVAYVAVLMRFSQTVCEQMRREQAAAKFIPTPGFVPLTPPYPKIQREGTPEEIAKQMRQQSQQHTIEAKKMRTDPASAAFYAVQARRTFVIHNLNSSRHMGTFLRKLILTFPRDGATIQKHIRMAGYESDEECALAIEDIFPRTKETRFLFQGLPSEAAIVKYREAKATAVIEAKKREEEELRVERLERWKNHRRLRLVSLRRLEEIYTGDLAKLTEPAAKTLKQDAIKRVQQEREELRKQLEEEAAQDSPAERIRKRRAELAVLSQKEESKRRNLELYKEEKYYESMKRSWQVMAEEKAKLEAELVAEISANTPLPPK